MDSLSRSNIIAFIQYFELKKPDGVVSFDAYIDFRMDGNSKSIETEVQIVTSGNLEAVYLINPEITDLGLPDTFSSGSETFIYVPAECLEIHGGKTSRAFAVLIFPKITPGLLP